VLAVIFFVFCLLGLLFLLIKDTKTTGHVQVSVQGHGHYHATTIPASSPAMPMQINQQVNYARSLAA
jgi:cell division septal protein FtsQ